MKKYDAPAITGERKLEGALEQGRSWKPISDADVKHGVESVEAYEAPTIGDRQELRGSLVAFSRDT